MDSKQATNLLRDPKVFEQVFREGGVLEAEVTRGEGEGEVTSIENHEFNLREYLGTNDATWMFPRVASNVLIEAAEPVLTVTPLLNTVRVNTGIRTVDYQAVGAIQAHEVAEGHEYPEEQATWARGARTAKITKKGLKVPITDEMVEDSLFDVVGMYMRAAGRAMARYKEQLALARFKAAAYVAIDNDDGGKPDTTGVGKDGAANKTLDGHDLMSVFGTMLASGRTPSTVIMNPLAWTMWADDPLLRNLQWFREPVGRAQGNVLPSGQIAGATFDAYLQKTIPFGLRVITSPYVDYDPATKKTDIYVVDANDLGVITVREDLSTEQWNDPERDIVSMKVKERYDITMLDTEGYNIVAIQNVIVDRNYGTDVTFVNTLA